MDNPNSIFAQNMRILLEARGFTHKALSDATGLGQASIARFVSGAVKPRPKSLKALSASLRVDEKTLLSTPITDVDAVTIPESPPPQQAALFSEGVPTESPKAKRTGAYCPIVKLERLRDYFLTAGESGSSGTTEVPGGIEADGLIAVPVEEADESIGILKGDVLFVRLGAFFRNGDLVVVNREKDFVVGKVSVDPKLDATLTVRGETRIPFALGGADKVVALLRLF